MPLSPNTLQSVIESAPGPCAVFDPALTVAAVNEAFLRATDTAVSAVLHHTASEIFHTIERAGTAEDAAPLIASLERVLATGAPHRLRTVRLEVWQSGDTDAGREERFWDVISYPVFDDARSISYVIQQLEDVTELVRLRSDNRVVSIIPTGVDITERLQAEHRQRATAILESITDAFYAVDREWRFTYINHEAERLLGRTREELTGKHIWEEFPLAAQLEFYPAYHRAMFDKVPVAFEIFYPPHDRWYAVNAYPSTEGISVYFRDITRRKHSEEQLSESQARLALAVEIAQMGTFDIDLETDAVRVNESGRAIYGWPTTETTFTSVQNHFHPDDRGNVIREVQRALDPRGSGTFEIEQRIFRADGEERWIRVRGRALFEHGQAKRLAGAYLDFTERKRNEESLRRSEEKLRFLATLDSETRSLTEADGITAVTARLLGEHLKASRCAYAEVEDERVFVFTGDYPRGVPSIVGRWPVDAFGAECLRRMQADEPYVITDTDSDPRIMLTDLAAYRATQIRSVICIPLHKGGKFTAAMAVHDASPRDWTPEEIELVQLVVSRCWESLERMRVARILRESEERLRTLVSQATAGIAEVNLDGRFMLVNQRFCETLGYSEEELLEMRMQDVSHPEDLPRNMELFSSLTRGGSDFQIEKRYVRKDGGLVWVNNSVAAIRGPDGRPQSIVAVVFDVTKRRRAETALRASEEALRGANRRKDEFLAMLAHELRNPLSAIGNAVQLIRRSPAPDHLEWAKEVINRQVVTLSRMMDDLLDVSRITRGKVMLQRSTVDIHTIATAAIDTVRPFIEERHHRLVLDLAPAPLTVNGDPTRLEQVIANLLVNAAKYTDPGGEITLGARPEGDWITVTVADNGSGIPPEKLPQMFELFAQGDRSVARSEGGLGVGLTLVKSLVELHEGSVSAKSEGPGRGSEFTVRLPAERGLTTDRPPTHDRQPHPLRDRSKILVVDDNVDSAQGLARLLRVLGHDVREAFDGMSALETARSQRPDFILLDIGLPGMDGYEVAAQLRAEGFNDAVIIAVSGYGEETARRRAREAGFDHHLVKPVDYDTLTALIRRMH